MPAELLTSPGDLAAYARRVQSHPHGSLWQSLEWKQYQKALGREVRIYALREGEEILASALVVIDRTTGGFSTWDIPRGPLGPIDNGKLIIDNLMKAIIADANKAKCLSLYYSPLKEIIFNYQLSIINSARHEQPLATRILDLRSNEEALLAQMKPKGRYNIRVAEKHGVVVKDSRDVDAWYSLAQATGERDRFGILPKRQYQTFLERLPGSFLLLAEHEKKPVAGLIGVIWRNQGIYYYGASSYEHRALMAPYALQLAAMRLCKAKGCTRYDLLGIAPEGAANHPWASVSAFKEKFGGSVVTYPPEQQIILRPMLERALRWKRRLVG